MGTERPATYAMRAEQSLRESHEMRTLDRELREARLAMLARLQEDRAELHHLLARTHAYIDRR